MDTKSSYIIAELQCRWIFSERHQKFYLRLDGHSIISCNLMVIPYLNNQWHRDHETKYLRGHVMCLYIMYQRHFWVCNPWYSWSNHLISVMLFGSNISSVSEDAPDLSCISHCKHTTHGLWSDALVLACTFKINTSLDRLRKCKSCQ